MIAPFWKNSRCNLPTAAQVFREAEENLRFRRIPEALNAYQRAEKLGYDMDRCAGARWVCHMLLGDFRSAWEESEAIAGRGKPDPNKFWNGESPTNRHVLIRCLHGLGDTIQFIRYAPLIRAQAASLVIEAQPALKTLLAGSGLADRVITWGDAEPRWDLQVEVIELPRVLRTSLETIPKRVPYLKATSTGEMLRSTTLDVGLVWASSGYNRARCIPLKLLGRICATPNCRFFALQAGEEAAEIQQCGVAVHDFKEKSGCVLSTARRVMDMDLIITVDTMMAHLAGALGVPVWTILPFEADWRWMLKRRDSPWYPTMRLFRQQEPGEWEPVVDMLQVELSRLVARSEAKSAS